MARFLADENFLGDAVAALREAGHDVAWVRTDALGSLDREVLVRAVAEQRILLTFDKDFGELAYRYQLPAACGIVLFRIALPSPHAVVRLIKAVLQSRDDWAGHFSVVEEHRLRMRPLPRA